MEVLLGTSAVLTLLLMSILIGTGGKPMRFVTAFGEFLSRLFHNRWPLFFTFACAGLVLLFLYIVYVLPEARLSAEQPIPFSHRVHAGVKQINCRFCHPYVERSTYPGLPPVEKCLYCHQYIIADHPQIRKEHRYFDTDTPTPWRKANFLPEHVFFNHQRHLKRDIQCQACHGKVQTMDRILGQRFKMGFCLECHRKRDAQVGCWLACHN